MGPGITASFNAAMKQLLLKAGRGWQTALATPKSLDRAIIFDFALNFCQRICPNGK